MEGEVLFLGVEEEEEPEEAWLNVIPVENKEKNLGNVPIEREKKAKKHMSLKDIKKWKKKQQKEEETS